MTGKPSPQPENQQPPMCATWPQRACGNHIQLKYCPLNICNMWQHRQHNKSLWLTALSDLSFAHCPLINNLAKASLVFRFLSTETCCHSPACCHTYLPHATTAVMPKSARIAHIFAGASKNLLPG